MHFGLHPHTAPYELSALEINRYLETLEEMEREAQAAKRRAQARH